jgi:hypothetical protein
VKSAFITITKSTLYLHNTPYNLEQNILHIHIFKNKLVPITAVQQRQHVDGVGCDMFFSGLISVFVFDILQIQSGCIQK